MRPTPDAPANRTTGRNVKPKLADETSRKPGYRSIIDRGDDIADLEPQRSCVVGDTDDECPVTHGSKLRAEINSVQRDRDHRSVNRHPVMRGHLE
jgi:hypothetical protein